MKSIDSITLSRKQFVRLVTSLTGLGDYPNPDDPLPDGPWGPIIRETIYGRTGYSAARSGLAEAGPQPQPWRTQWESVLLNPQPLPPRWVWSAVNPQPLPPRWAWSVLMAQAIVADIQRTMHTFRLLPPEFQEQAVEATRHNLAALVDDWCGTGKPRWPFPWPGPGPDPDPRDLLVTPLDLIMSGTLLAQLAGTVSEQLREAVVETAVALQNAGLEQL